VRYSWTSRPAADRLLACGNH